MKKLDRMSDPEREWETYWRQLAPHLPAGDFDQKFSEDRDFRFDFQWPVVKIAVEIEGGNWVNGGHNRGAGYEKDCTKYNLAADLGWVVYRFTPTMLKRDPANCVGQVAQAISKRSK